MNRRDAALIAHLDAIDARWTAAFTQVINRFDRIDDALTQIRADLAGIKLELATHGHNGGEG
jgi:hypothetical protein